MKKCWEIVGQVQYEAFKDDYAAYPNFTTIYQSDEVRGDGDGDKGGDRRQKGHAPDDSSPHGLAQAAADAIEALATDRSLWRHLTDDDIELLRDTKDKLRVLIRDIGR
jgi:hypothetical protein